MSSDDDDGGPAKGQSTSGRQHEGLKAWHTCDNFLSDGYPRNDWQSNGISIYKRDNPSS